MAFRGVRNLDIDYKRANIIENIRSSGFRQLFGPSSSLTTLIIRNFPPQYMDNIDPNDCSTIRSFSVSFSKPFYFRPNTSNNAVFGGFETLTDVFSLPNIEHLEILGGFSGGRIEDRHVQVLDEWEAPLFPYLQTLRLEDVSFSRTGFAFIQHFSRNITALQLIYTTRNHNLLTDPEAWPALRALTIETRVVVAPSWLVPFVTTRSELGHPLSQLTLPLWEGDMALSLAECRPPPAIHHQRTGPSPALMDGIYGTGFYIDEYDMRPTDFVHVPYPKVRKCRCCEIDWSAYPEWWMFETDIERLEEELAADFKAEGEVVRAKGIWRELRRERRRERKVGPMSRGSKARHFRRNQGYEILRDFTVV
ncbi:hypothetical protein MVEN_01954600 [Mycena venus]|uniref:Uncharacterized protein n=1 Tax=Mycena venus TaxID=2733690 RepID=A0A8H6XH50_9AGAR|nr:hypothetical protein MVEN_01954600 [Mycena venus]